MLNLIWPLTLACSCLLYSKLFKEVGFWACSLSREASLFERHQYFPDAFAIPAVGAYTSPRNCAAASVVQYLEVCQT